MFLILTWMFLASFSLIVHSWHVRGGGEAVISTFLWICLPCWLLLGGDRHTTPWGEEWAPPCSDPWGLTRGWPSWWPGSSEPPACSGSWASPFYLRRWPEVAGTGPAHNGPVHNADAEVGPRDPERTCPKRRAGSGSALCDVKKRGLGRGWDGPLGWYLGCRQLHRGEADLIKYPITVAQ